MAMGLHLSAGWAWVSALVYVFGAATTSVGLARRLPLQNVLAVTFVIVGVAAVATMLGAKLHKPFGDFEPSDTSGSLVVGKLFWFPAVLADHGGQQPLYGETGSASVAPG